MKYYTILKQKGEGCDYSIGCGEKLISFDADSDEGAASYLEQEIKDTYTGDYELDSALLFPAESLVPIDIKAIYKRNEDSKKKENEDNQREKELAEFQRLKEKFNM